MKETGADTRTALLQALGLHVVLFAMMFAGLQWTRSNVAEAAQGEVIEADLIDPTALGAEGSKGTGPGSLSVRNRLSIPAQAGFDSSFAFHVRQNYNNVYPAKLCVLE